MKRKWFIEVGGWYGVLAILFAFALVSFNVISGGSLAYLMLNLTGALGIVIVSFAKKDHQPAVLNIIWACIAIIAILKAVL